MSAIQFYSNEEEKPRQVSHEHPLPVKVVGGSVGGGDAQPSDVIQGKTFTNDDGEQTGTMPDQSGNLHQNTSWDNDDGNISVSIVVPKGYYPGGEENLHIQDPDLTPENIRSGENIFGVEGTFTSDADATEEDIANGKVAYVNGKMVTGTLIHDIDISHFIIQVNATGFGSSGEAYVLFFDATESELKEHLFGVNVKFDNANDGVWEYESGKSIDLSTLSFSAFKVDDSIVGDTQTIELDGSTLDFHFGVLELNGGQLQFDIVFNVDGGTFQANNNNPMITVDVWTY